MDPDRLELERQWRAVQEWLDGDDARAAASHEMRGTGLYAFDLDDLLADTAVRVWRTLRDRTDPIDEGDDGRGLVRYARRALRHAAVDALRAAARRPEVPVPEPIELWSDDDPDDVYGWLPFARRALHGEMEESPRSAAAGLATTAVIAERLELAPDVPQPERGATPSQAALWAGVWFVEGDALFPVDADAAARQRRSRATNRAMDVLSRCMAASGFRSDDG